MLRLCSYIFYAIKIKNVFFLIVHLFLKPLFIYLVFLQVLGKFYDFLSGTITSLLTSIAKLLFLAKY